MLLTTLERYKVYYELIDNSLDEQIKIAIEQASAEIETACNTVFEKVPADVEKACMIMVSMALERRGSEHLSAEAVGPLNSTFADNFPQIIERHRVIPV